MQLAGATAPKVYVGADAAARKKCYAAWREWLPLHADKVERLILVDAAGLPRAEPMPLAFRLFRTPGVGRLVRWISPHFMIAKSVRETYGDPSRVSNAAIDFYEDILLRDGNREATRERFSGNDDGDGLHARVCELHVPTLILWGKNDKIFPADGAYPYKRDLPEVEFHLIDTGHFALEDKSDEMVPLIRDFLARKFAS